MISAWRECWMWTIEVGGGARLSARDRQHEVQRRLAGRCQPEFRHECGETTPPLVGPVEDFVDDARQVERGKLLTQRFQHADENGLPAGAAERFAGAARFASHPPRPT